MSRPMIWAQLGAIVILGLAAAWVVIRSYTGNRSSKDILARIFALVLVIVGVGIGAGSFFGSFFPPIFAVIATGIVTFFGLLNHAIRSTPQGRIKDRDVRIAIASSITTMYVVLVGYGVWVGWTGQPDPIAQSLITSFSAVVATVIAFYFGTTAYVEGKTGGAPVRKPSSESSTD